MASDSTAALDYSPPDRSTPSFDLPIVTAAAVEICWIILFILGDHSEPSIASGIWATSILLFLTGAIRKPIGRRAYPLAILFALAILAYNHRYRSFEEITADGLGLFLLLNPAVAVLLWRLRGVDRLLLGFSVVQLAMIPTVVTRLPAYPWWIRYGPESAKWIYFMAWGGYCGLLLGALSGLVTSVRSSTGSHCWLMTMLLLSAVSIFLARMWLDEMLRRAGVWITPHWDDTYPTPDRDPQLFRIYFLAAASPLTLLLLFRLLTSMRSRSPASCRFGLDDLQTIDYP